MSLLRQFAKADGNADGSSNSPNSARSSPNCSGRAVARRGRVGRGGRGAVGGALASELLEAQRILRCTTGISRGTSTRGAQARAERVEPRRRHPAGARPPPTRPPSPYPLTLPHPLPQARDPSRFDANHDHKLDLEFTESSVASATSRPPPPTPPPARSPRCAPPSARTSCTATTPTASPSLTSARRCCAPASTPTRASPSPRSPRSSGRDGPMSISTPSSASPTPSPPTPIREAHRYSVPPRRPARRRRRGRAAVRRVEHVEEIPDDPYAVRPPRSSAAAPRPPPPPPRPPRTVVAPDGRVPAAARQYRAALALATYRGATAAAPIPPSPKEEGGAADARYGDPLKAGRLAVDRRQQREEGSGDGRGEAHRAAARRGGRPASPADPAAVVPKVALHKLPPKEPYAAAKAKPPATGRPHEAAHAPPTVSAAPARDADVCTLHIFYYSFEARHESIHHTVFTPERALAKSARSVDAAASPAAWPGRRRAAAAAAARGRRAASS